MDLTAASAKRQTRKSYCSFQSIGWEKQALHRNLKPVAWHKFLGRLLSGALLVAAAATGSAQDSTDLSTYRGPGVASPGVGNIGMRSGEQVDLRYYVGVSGVVNTNLQPFALDAQGNLLRIHNLYGIDVNGGVYGVHRWKHSQLGVDYGGDYLRNVNSDSYNVTNQRLSLGYTVQPTRRWTLDLQEAGGTITTANNELVNTQANEANSVVTPTTLLFDSRTSFLQSSAYATYLQSARNSFTFGGSGFLNDQKSVGLSNSGGYTATGSMHRRMSKNTTVGASYTYSHMEFPGFHSNSDSNSYQGTFATVLGQYWTFSLEAGATVTEINSQITLTLSPELAALFGQATIIENGYSRTTYPSGSATLERKFKRADLRFNYSRGLNAGNGATGSARQEGASMAFSYTGIRKLNLGVNGGHYNLVSIGLNTGTYAYYTGSAGFTYALGRSISLSARYSVNHQQVDVGSYVRTTTLASLGLVFSPGNIPLALW